MVNNFVWKVGDAVFPRLGLGGMRHTVTRGELWWAIGLAWTAGLLWGGIVVWVVATT